MKAHTVHPPRTSQPRLLLFTLPHYALGHTGLLSHLQSATLPPNSRPCDSLFPLPGFNDYSSLLRPVLVLAPRIPRAEKSQPQVNWDAWSPYPSGGTVLIIQVSAPVSFLRKTGSAR